MTEVALETVAPKTKKLPYGCDRVYEYGTKGGQELAFENFSGMKKHAKVERRSWQIGPKGARRTRHFVLVWYAK